MGTLRGKLIDRNRYSKRYPLIRAPKRTTYIGDGNLEIEVGSIYFDNTNTGTLSYEAPFPDTNYQISVSARQTSAAEGADVNLYITSKTENSVTVVSSGPFTGYVDVFAVRIS